METRERLSYPVKIGLLSALYFAQGLPFGFFHRAVPVMLREAGQSLAVVSSSALLALPWALKFLWAPWVDRHGSRKAWIVPLQAASVLVLALLAVVPPVHALYWLMGAFFVANLLSATQDIATDGLALDVLTERERGGANGIQVAGYRFGMLLGGGALLVVFEVVGWTPSFLLMALLLALTTLPLLLTNVPGKAHVPSARSTAWQNHFLSRKGAWTVVGLVALYKIPDALGTAMITPFLVDRGLRMGELGVMLGTIGSLASIAGALSGGASVSRIGRMNALVVFGVLSSLPFFAYAYAARFELNLVALYALAAAEHFFGAMATAALFTCMMDFCEPGSASDYTFQASVVVIATGVFGALSGVFAGIVGYAVHFGVAGVLAFGVSLLCAGLFNRVQTLRSSRAADPSV